MESNQERMALAERLEREGAFFSARAIYLEILRSDADDYDALWRLGHLLKRTHYRSAAHLTFAQMIRAFPNDPAGYLASAHLFREEQNWAQARHYYVLAIEHNRKLWSAYQGLSYVLEELGESALASQYRDIGFSSEPLTHLPHTGEKSHPIRVLQLVTATGGNTPTSLFLRPDRYHMENLVVEYWPHGLRLPTHDIVFNAVSDADVALTAMTSASQWFTNIDYPIINAPPRLKITGRLAMAEHLGKIPGVRVPRIRQYSKRTLTHNPSVIAEDGFRMPVFLRSVGFHGGRHFVKVSSKDSLRQTVDRLPGESLWVIESLSTLHDNGEFHKYRMMMIAGVLYPVHSVYSTHWNVHDHTALDDVIHRTCEEDFLHDAPRTVGRVPWNTLQAIARVCPWDYGGIDFDVSDRGEVMVFEANATMAIPDLTQVPLNSSRYAAWQALHEALHQLITRRAQPKDKRVIEW